MNRFWIYILLIIAPRAGLAQAPAPVDPAVCTLQLDGHVVDADSHEAIAGATIRVGGRSIAETDLNGLFSLTALCPGPLVIEAERADCAPVTRTVTITGPAPTSVEIELQPLTDEVIQIEEEAPDSDDMRATAVISGAALERTRGRAFSEALAEVPGVTQLRSASGMAKPIVRGQFGRRLLMLVDGIRHRAQEWGLDHAPEIDPFVADKLTVVRGASGVRYGPDAIGGAVLVDPPELLREPGVKGEVHLVGISNGHGGTVATRVQAAPQSAPGLAFQVEGSLRRLAASRTPDYALDNTGVDEWNVGATVGYRRRSSQYRLSYLRYQAKLGVCSCLRIESMDDFYAQIAQERPVGVELYSADFEIERPYQAVAHDLAIARGRWTFDDLGTLTATYALQYDHRREYDIVRGSITGAQFNFRLFTNELDVSLEHNPIHLNDHWHVRGAAGIVGVAQIHNYAGLPLVPDYSSFGGGVYALERLIGHDLELEAGVRYDVLARTASLERQDYLRLVRSDQLAMDACAGSDTFDCESTFHTVSASIGALVRITDEASAKLDLSTASRPPNTDEQYLNGTSPTFPVLALGKPDLGPETTYSSSLTAAYKRDGITAELSGYANVIKDYIYFAPALDASGAPIFDVTIQGAFPRFNTRPVDALFYGVDGGVSIAPIAELELGAQLSIVRANNTTDDGYLVFVPADQYRGFVTVKPPPFLGLDKGFVTVSGNYVARQRRSDLAADFAPPPDPYFLLGAEVGAETKVGDQTLKLALQGANLLNQRYRDYTSLLRYFADQPGWQLMLRATLQFSSN